MSTKAESKRNSSSGSRKEEHSSKHHSHHHSSSSEAKKEKEKKPPKTPPLPTTEEDDDDEQYVNLEALEEQHPAKNGASDTSSPLKPLHSAPHEGVGGEEVEELDFEEADTAGGDEEMLELRSIHGGEGEANEKRPRTPTSPAPGDSSGQQPCGQDDETADDEQEGKQPPSAAKKRSKLSDSPSPHRRSGRKEKPSSHRDRRYKSSSSYDGKESGKKQKMAKREVPKAYQQADNRPSEGSESSPTKGHKGKGRSSSRSISKSPIREGAGAGENSLDARLGRVRRKRMAAGRNVAPSRVFRGGYLARSNAAVARRLRDEASPIRAGDNKKRNTTPPPLAARPRTPPRRARSPPRGRSPPPLRARSPPPRPRSPVPRGRSPPGREAWRSGPLKNPSYYPSQRDDVGTARGGRRRSRSPLGRAPPPMRAERERVRAPAQRSPPPRRGRSPSPRPPQRGLRDYAAPVRRDRRYALATGAAGVLFPPIMAGAGVG